MLHYGIPFIVLVTLAVILLICVEVGRGFATRQLKKSSKLEMVSVAESSVFGLLALLIAFTFSGAYERYENRKLHLVSEASAFNRAFDYIDLLQPQYQTEIRQKLENYLTLHIKSYKDIPYLKKVATDIQEVQAAQGELWKNIVIACKANPNQSLAQVVAEGFTAMFETVYAGANLTRIHPPAVIFVLMIGLAALGAVLIGYDSAENTNKRHIHVLCYVLITAFTIYLIINLEFPRVGFIQMNYFDNLLISTRNSMG